MPVEEFDERYFDQLRAAADHWWVRGMRDIADALLGPPDGAPVVLDSGCGSGANLEWLAVRADGPRVAGIDVSAAGLAACGALGATADLAQASVTAMPFAGATFDLVVNMDVLQHLTEADAEHAARELCRVLRPGGRALVRTNARFGRRRVPEREDWRLYTPDSLRAVLTAGGLSVDRVTPVNFLQGVWASLPRPPRPTHDGDHGEAHDGHHGLGIPTPVSPRRNAAMLRLLHLEARWLAGPRRRLPAGHSLYALAHRPG